MRLLITSLFMWGVLSTFAAEKERTPLPFGDANAPASGPNGDQTEIRFVNQRPQLVKIFWYDQQKVRHLYGTLKAGEEKIQNSYAGHTWLITDEHGYPLGHFMATKHPGLAVITKK